MLRRLFRDFWKVLLKYGHLWKSLKELHRPITVPKEKISRRRRFGVQKEAPSRHRNRSAGLLCVILGRTVDGDFRDPFYAFIVQWLLLLSSRLYMTRGGERGCTRQVTYTRVGSSVGIYSVLETNRGKISTPFTPRLLVYSPVPLYRSFTIVGTNSDKKLPSSLLIVRLTLRGQKEDAESSVNWGPSVPAGSSRRDLTPTPSAPVC